MKIKELRAILDSVGDEEAEVYVDKPHIEGHGNWEGHVYKTFHAARKFVDPIWRRVAKRPCQETKGSQKSLVIYVDAGN